MKQYFYSEKLNKSFETEEECLKAEKEFEEKEAAKKAEAEKKRSERKVRAEEIEVARKEMYAAKKKYSDLLTSFCKDYGYYHTSTSSRDIPYLFDFLNLL